MREENPAGLSFMMVPKLCQGSLLDMCVKRNGTAKMTTMRLPGDFLPVLALCFLVLLMSFSEPVSAAGGASVSDRARLLTLDERERLEEMAEELAEEYGYDLLLVTTDDAGGATARDYADEFYEEYATGDDGAVYLIDMDNREIYISTSGRMRYILNDDRIEELLDACYNRVREGDYAGGFSKMLEKTERFLEAGVEKGTYTVDEVTGERHRYRAPNRISGMEALIALAAAVISGGALFGTVSGRYQMKRGSDSYAWQENCRLRLQGKQDTLVNRVVTRRRIPRPSSTGSGGGSGGSRSTVHTSSSGRSHGGGGRKF